MAKFLGAMSGTSADGVDVALLEIEGPWPRPAVRLAGHHHRPYPPELRRRIFAARHAGAIPLEDLGHLGQAISQAYAVAVNEAMAARGWSPAGVTAVAAHGQTLYHQPPVTIQWLDPALLAAQTGCAVVSDFRRADCAVGGQGAPLVPFADWVLFGDEHQGRAVLNLGGIANVTHLPPGVGLEQVIAFDTGPANCLSDWLCRTLDPEGPGYDAQGARALKGQVMEAVAERFLAGPYFQRRPPKSTDGPEMIAAFQSALSAKELDRSNLNALLATAAYLTARTVVEAAAPWPVSQWIISGGGIRNEAIMRHLRAMLPRQVTIRRPEEWGIAADAKEALAFALLAAATLAGVPSNVPSVTGATQPMLLGSLTPQQQIATNK